MEKFLELLLLLLFSWKNEKVTADIHDWSAAYIKMTIFIVLPNQQKYFLFFLSFFSIFKTSMFIYLFIQHTNFSYQLLA